MQELIVLSGKGGTGKTSVMAGLATLADDAILVDCDVEAPDLHLLLSPTIEQSRDFEGGEVAWLRPDQCIGCGRCAELCRYDAIVPYGPPNRFADQTYIVQTLACEGCRLCAEICPNQAIAMVPTVCGEWHMSGTRCGPLVHAQLKPGHGNSGKLVTHLRNEARRLAQTRGAHLVLGDGVPGVGCPVIASVSGATLALIVVEPSLSGRHDFERVVELTRHFNVPAVVCVNKYDIDVELTAEIEAWADSVGVRPIGRIPRDPAVVAAQMAERTIIEHDSSPAARAIHSVWAELCDELGV